MAKSKTGLPSMESKQRNWYIFRLRAIYHNVGFIQDPDRVEAIQEIVDQEIMSTGAIAEGVRDARRRQLVNDGDWETYEKEFPVDYKKRPRGSWAVNRK